MASNVTLANENGMRTGARRTIGTGVVDKPTTATLEILLPNVWLLPEGASVVTSPAASDPRHATRLVIHDIIVTRQGLVLLTQAVPLPHGQPVRPDERVDAAITGTARVGTLNWPRGSRTAVFTEAPCAERLATPRHLEGRAAALAPRAKPNGRWPVWPFVFGFALAGSLVLGAALLSEIDAADLWPVLSGSVQPQ